MKISDLYRSPPRIEWPEHRLKWAHHWTPEEAERWRTQRDARRRAGQARLADRLAAIIARRAEGKTLKQIGEEFGISAARVADLLKRPEKLAARQIEDQNLQSLRMAVLTLLAEREGQPGTRRLSDAIKRAVERSRPRHEDTS